MVSRFQELDNPNSALPSWTGVPGGLVRAQLARADLGLSSLRRWSHTDQKLVLVKDSREDKDCPITASKSPRKWWRFPVGKTGGKFKLITRTLQREWNLLNLYTYTKKLRYIVSSTFLNMMLQCCRLPWIKNLIKPGLKPFAYILYRVAWSVAAVLYIHIKV